MEETKQKLAQELVSIGQRLLALGNQLTSERRSISAVDAAVQEQIDRRLCLQCLTGIGVPPNKPYRRGLCAMHYQRTLVRIQAGQVTEEALISTGMMSPEPSKGGRKIKGADPVGALLNTSAANAKADSVVAEIETAGNTLNQKRKAKVKK